MPQSYRGYAYKPQDGTLFATDKVAVCHSQNLHVYISARWSTSLDAHCTQILGLRVNILVNIAVYPAILPCSRSQFDENIV